MDPTTRTLPRPASRTPAPEPAPGGLLDTLVDGTPDHRDRVVDLLRAASIAVVVLWHWVFSITQWRDGSLRMPNPIDTLPGAWALTWFLQVMPLFFVVGGYANLAAWDAARRRGDGAGAFLRSRLDRLGRPIAVMVGCWAVGDSLARTFVDGYAGVLSWGMVVFVPLWFLAVYVGVVALTPVMARLHEQGREIVPVALGAIVLTADLLRFRHGVEGAGWVTSVAVWVFAHQLGFFWRDGSLLRGGRRTAVAVTLGGVTALVGLTNLGVYPRSMVSVRGEAISNMYPTTACIAGLALFQLGLVLLARPALARWTARRPVWKRVVAVNAVAMTVFTWHMTALVAAIGLWQLGGGELATEADAGWWLQRPVWLVLPGVLLAGLSLAFARFELPGGARGRTRASR
jgi:hypothetical protein